VAARPGKLTGTKKSAVDRFNDSRQEETRRLDLKRKMEHDEKMASIRLKKHKYDLRYGSPQLPCSPAETQTKEDKQIEILRLQIRLAELNRENSVAARASSSQLPYEEVSTPSSAMSAPSYISSFGHNGFVDNSNTTFPSDEAPDAGALGAAWPEFNFAA
jgi:hypothetical protein